MLFKQLIWRDFQGFTGLDRPAGLVNKGGFKSGFMMMITIYHNPRCSKSRQTLELIRAKGIEPEIVLYLQDTLSADAIKNLLGKLGFESARDLMRRGEQDYKDQNLKTQSDEQALIKAMADHPKLIERPIVVKGNRAVLGRPPENVNSLI